MILNQLGIIERDRLSIHLNGDNDTSISANILFPQGITIPDRVSPNEYLQIGDGTSGTGLDGVYQLSLIDDGAIRELYFGTIPTSSSVNGLGVGITFATQAVSTVGGQGGYLNFTSGSGPTTGTGGEMLFRAGQGGTGGILSMRGGGSITGTNYGYIRTGQTGLGGPNKLVASSSDTRDSVYIYKNLEVDGTTWLDGNALVGGTLNVTGATTLATSLTGILKGTSGLVAVASSSDILATIDFGTVMLKTDAGVTTFYEPSADTDAARGIALATAIAAHAAGDTIVVGPGTYEMTDDFTLLAGASLIGQGRPTLYCNVLTDKPLIRLINNNITVQGIDLQTNLVGLGELSATPITVSGIVIRDVTHTPLSVTDCSGLQFSQVVGGGSAMHVVSLDAYNSKFHGGSTTGYGVHMSLDDGSEINLTNCDVYGATDGILNKNTDGKATGVTNIFGGTYASVLDAITSGGTGNVINVYGATARGSQADLYGDDGSVSAYWVDARTDYIVGNGVNTTKTDNVVGNLNLIAGQLTYNAFGGGIDAGLRRIAASTLQVTNGSTTRADLEVADEAYNATNWNGSFEVPTKNALRDQIELMPTLAANNVFAGANTFQGDVTISKATPAIFLTDSGGDDYTIDVGSTASLLRIRNVTDSANGLQIDGSGNVAVSTSYAPQSSAKFYAQDRTTSPSATARAAFTATQEVVPSGAFTGGNQRGFLGGVSFIANQNSTAGAAMIGLEGGVTVSSTAGFTQTSLNGLFGTLNFTGGSTITLSNAVSTFVSLGTGSVATTLRHIAVGSTQATGGASIGTLIGFYAPAMTLGTTANYEGWMDTDAGWFFREGGNQINSRAAATLDIDATTTLNFRVGGAIEAVLTANRLTTNNGASDTYLDWSTSGRLDIGGGALRATGTAIIQSTDFAPYSTSYELSVQSNTGVTYIEILNNAGTGLGAFFGLASNQFELWNYQGSGAGSGNYETIFYGGWGSVNLLELDRQGGTIFNNPGNDVDFRIEGDTLTHAIFLDASAATENIALVAAAAPNWQAMDRGMFIGEATTIPTGNPTSGGFAYVEGGALKWRSPAGTITTMGAA